MAIIAKAMRTRMIIPPFGVVDEAIGRWECSKLPAGLDTLCPVVLLGLGGLLLGGEEGGDLGEVLLGERLLLLALGVALGDLDGLSLGEGVGLAPPDPGPVGADVASELDALDLEEVGDVLAGVGLLRSGDKIPSFLVTLSLIR
jgi:hypothetical protein